MQNSNTVSELKKEHIFALKLGHSVRPAFMTLTNKINFPAITISVSDGNTKKGIEVKCNYNLKDCRIKTVNNQAMKQDLTCLKVSINLGTKIYHIQ